MRRKNFHYIFILLLFILFFKGDIFMAEQYSREELVSMARRIATNKGLDPDIFVGMIQHESNFNPNARGAAGEIGLGQIMLSTALDPGYGIKPIKAGDRFDPVSNLNFSADFLKQMLNETGDYKSALGAYNAGLGNLRKGNYSSNYIKSVMGLASKPVSRPDVVSTKSTDSSSTSRPDAPMDAIPAAEQNRLNKMLQQIFSTDSPKASAPPRPRAGSRMGNTSELSKLRTAGALGRSMAAPRVYSSMGISSLRG